MGMAALAVVGGLTGRRHGGRGDRDRGAAQGGNGHVLPSGPAMKTMTVFEARNHFAKTLDAAKEDPIIVTRNGKPVAAIQAIGDDDIEDLLLERRQ
jgi:prevent-host-death family protein